MGDILIIAPTHSYYRDPAQKEINDQIKDQTDAVNLEQKIAQVVPKTVRKSPDETEQKVYHDMRMIRKGNKDSDQAARFDFFSKEYSKNENGVAFPDTGAKKNLCYTRIQQDCKSQS